MAPHKRETGILSPSNQRQPRTSHAPKDVLLSSKSKHGLSTEPVPVSAYVGSSKNLKDLKDAHVLITVLRGMVTPDAGVPRSKEGASPWHPLLGLCLEPYGGPGGVALPYERGTPVLNVE